MRDLFPEYYYSEPNFEDLWEHALFVLDTNVLLGIYSLSPETSKTLVKIVEHLAGQNRIWLPHQFAQEYHAHLLTIKREVLGEYRLVTSGIEDTVSGIKRHTGINVDTEIKKLGAIKKTIKDLENTHFDRLKHNKLRDAIADAFDGRVGDPYPDSELEKIYEEGRERYARQIPPGFKDVAKGEPYCFGDLVGWKQILAEANIRKLTVVLVTGDINGDDWFYKPTPNRGGKDQPKGPRPELVREMRSEASVDFHLFETSRFIGYANKQLNKNATAEENQALVAEVEARSRHRSRAQTSSLFAHADRERKRIAEQYERNALAQIALSGGTGILNDVALQRLGGQYSKQINAMLRPLVEGADAQAARAVGQAVKGVPFDTRYIYGLGPSLGRLPDQGDEEEWENEADSDETTGNDPNDDDGSDDQEPKPTTVEP